MERTKYPDKTLQQQVSDVEHQAAQNGEARERENHQENLTIRLLSVCRKFPGHMQARGTHREPGGLPELKTHSGVWGHEVAGGPRTEACQWATQKKRSQDL